MAEKGDFMEGPSREEGGVCPDLVRLFRLPSRNRNRERERVKRR